VFGYDGLYVADGSVMPGSVGPNPSLTMRPSPTGSRTASSRRSGRTDRARRRNECRGVPQP
jgi:cholesterol oxidase